MKKREFKAKPCVFLEATDLEDKIIQILYRKGQNKIWTELGQEPTFNSRIVMIFPGIQKATIYKVGFDNNSVQHLFMISA